jgi:uncharacterized protein YjbJ (UPF0337 family)
LVCEPEARGGAREGAAVKGQVGAHGHVKTAFGKVLGDLKPRAGGKADAGAVGGKQQPGAVGGKAQVAALDGGLEHRQARPVGRERQA